EESIKALVKHMLHSQRTRMSVEDYMAVCSKYPPAVWQEIKARPAQLDVSVEIVSGTGQLAERGKQEAMELWNNGQGPLSGDTLLERFGEDPKVESQNQVAAAERTAKAQRAIQAVAGVLQAAPTVGAPNNAPVPPAPVDQPAPDLAPAA
ncbi:MAG TPA: hypothetical protein VHM90_02920, partial [Phycisphaerae bacterium]|nr:hypothetical protein [Phycisphaerae bacterium]